MKSDAFVSVVLIVSDSSAYEAAVSIQQELHNKYSDYEIVMIAQGVEPITSKPLDDILLRLPSVRYIQLSGLRSNDVAWAAGLENAIGDFVVLFDYMSDPVSVISDIVNVCKSGFDIVVGVAKQQKTLSYKLMRYFAGHILSAIDYHLPKDATRLRCLSRRAVNSVTTTGRFHHQFYLRIQKTGYPSCSYTYDIQTSRLAKKTFYCGIRNLLSLLVFNSSRPLRWMSSLGLFGSSIAFLFAMYSILIHLVDGNVVQGWTTTILFMSMLFMLQFVMLAFFGEYIGRLLDDRSEQADYSVVFEKNSLVMVNQDRVNVLDQSINADKNFVQTGRDR